MLYNREFDLNLLPALKVLLSEKHISRAASRMGITQSAMSKMLDKLRQSFKDQLLIRRGGAYVLTPLALQLQNSLEAIMPSLSAIINGHEFDPSTINRVFTIAATDFGAFIVVPHLIDALKDKAATVRIVPWSDSIFDELRHGSVDIAFWPYPAPEGFNFRLVLRCGVKCLTQSAHAPASGRFTLEEYVERQHVSVIRSNKHCSLVDTLLCARGYCRSIKACVPYFMAAAYVAASSECVATVPELMAEPLAALTGTQIVAPPVDFPPIDYLQVWHESMDANVAHAWLRDKICKVCENIPFS